MIEEHEEECPECGGAGYLDYEDEGEYDECQTYFGEGVDDEDE